MGHGVGFHRTKFASVGRTAPRGHLSAQQRARTGGRKAFARMPHAHGLQQAVNLCRTDRQQFLLKSFGQRRGAPLKVFEPERQRGLEQLAAQLVARQPHFLEDGQQFAGLVDDFWARSFAVRSAQRPVQQPQRGFVMITAVEAKLVENAALVRTTGALVTAVNLGEILAFGCQTHSQVFGNHEYESTYRQTPRPPPSPGNI